MDRKKSLTGMRWIIGMKFLRRWQNTDMICRSIWTLSWRTCKTFCGKRRVAAPFLGGSRCKHGAQQLCKRLYGEKLSFCQALKLYK